VIGEEPAGYLDAIILLAGIALIVFTSLRVSRRRGGGKPSKGESAALIGIAVWLACLGVALYLIFG
jgi:hypothetical protein